jgi:hypothetical protein
MEAQDKLKTVLESRRPDLRIDFEQPYHAVHGILFRVTDAKGKTVAESKAELRIAPEDISDKTESQLWEWFQQFAVSGRL